MKRHLLLSAVLFAAASLFAQNPQVQTASGIIEGTDESGVKVFLGVPFAAPPVGDLRWKAPQPVESWSGVRQTKEYGPNPMQEAVFGDMNFGTKKMSEDCLYLNIWTPAKSMSEHLPVLIYFNGGGLMAGSGSEPRYAGMSMARRGIISVTANYREGIFGFYAHPELSKESSYKGSGNYGFMDQLAAIKWLKDNIAKFGGDPDRITIVGESAGSMSVSALMASPLSKGLFSQAMGSSGSVLGNRHVATLAEAEKAGRDKAGLMGCKSLKEMRSLPAEELMKRAAVNSVPVYNIDNYVLPKQPYEIYEKGEQQHVPLLVGGNNMEMNAMFLLGGKPATVANLRENLSKQFGEQTDTLLKVYGINIDADVIGEGGTALAGDIFIGYNTWLWSEMHRKTGGQPVYRYLYCHPRPAMRIAGKVAALAGGVIDKTEDAPSEPLPTGAVHSADIEYAMGNLPTNRVYDWQPEDYTVSDIFQSYYVNFVKTGNPNGLGLVDWAKANGSDVPQVLQLDVKTDVKADKKLEERYKLLNSLYRKKY